MVRNGEFSMADIKRVLRKHWWVLAACAPGLGIVSVLVAMRLPKKYTSQTLVLVARPAVEDYVKSVVTEDLTQRLASMKEQIVSRSRLQPVIEKFNLYAEDRNKVHGEDLIDRLRAAVTITLLEAMPGTQYPNLPGFSVNVTFNNPQVAQQICTEITSMFMEQNERALQLQASQRTSLIGQQLDEAKAKLDEQDAKLAQFKRQYIGLLPEETQSNLSLLGSLNSELDATTQALTRAQQDKAFNQTLLSRQETNWKGSQGGQNPETLEERSAPSTARRTAEPSQMQQLRATIQQEELNYQDLLKRQGKIQEQIKVLEGHIEASPMVDLQVKELTRNYQSALDFYNQLLKKRDNSVMPSDLVHQQEGEQFRVLDPPSLPRSPSFPKMFNFVAGGFGGGTALALIILYVLMAMDKTLHTEREVESYLKLPVLVSVPILEAAVGSSKLLKRPIFEGLNLR
ncbi:MAG: hypothetical protein DMG38_03525 [Acidobacteria bacterium]|nr:MAG: hypothetical protein DMG38_03525 [Acidobacteriota bacterium]